MKLNTVLRRRHPFDFEAFGFQIARETRDLAKAIELGGLKIHEYRASLQPDIDCLQSALLVASDQKAALCTQLYDSTEPVSDKAMLARKIILGILTGVLVGVILTSIAAHTYRLILFGLGAMFALVLGIVATLFVLGVGYLAFDKLLRGSRWLQVAVICVAACLMIWGMLLLAQAGGIAVSQIDAATNATDSYVDGASSEPSSQLETAQQTDQQHVEKLLSSAIKSILLSADLMLGILLGTVVLLRTDEQYATWKEIERLEQEIAQMQWKLKNLFANIEVAQRRCMGGILRFFHTQRKQFPPYFQAGAACVAIVMLASTMATAKSVSREEGILIDVSGSIGAGGANSELFREYLAGARQLLLTEPPSSRVVVSLISTESFGTQELLKGWTPAAHGVFTDDLNRARHQLASAFEAKSSGINPIAAGTDIVGGLWHIKTILESGSNSTTAVREVWIFSDFMNETQAFPMPALLSKGSETMLEYAKTNGLIVRLANYKVHLMGASMRGVSPQAWNTVKEFWLAYFRAAGAEVVSYSPESSALR